MNKVILLTKNDDDPSILSQILKLNNRLVYEEYTYYFKPLYDSLNEVDKRQNSLSFTMWPNVNTCLSLLNTEYIKFFISYIPSTMEVFGYCMLTCIDNIRISEVTHIIVDPNHRRSNIANQLLQKSIDFCKRNQYQNMYTKILINNQPSINLFEKNNFKFDMYINKLLAKFKLKL